MAAARSPPDATRLSERGRIIIRPTSDERKGSFVCWLEHEPVARVVGVLGVVEAADGGPPSTAVLSRCVPVTLRS